MPTSLNVHVSVKKARAGQVERNVRNALRRFSRAIKKEYEGTTDTWNDPADIPDFEARTSFKKGGDAIVTAGPADDGSHGYDIWRFLDQGTSIRWAELSHDWESKTTPGSMQSGEGAGHVIIAGRAMIDEGYPPRPGIEARDWTGQIQEEYAKKFFREIRAAVRSGLKG